MFQVLLVAAALSAADVRFQAWANAVAAEAHERIVAWGRADLDDRPGEQRIALLERVESGGDQDCSDGRHTVLVEDGPRRWRRSRCGREAAEATGVPRCAGVAWIADGKAPWARFPCSSLDFGYTYLGSHGWHSHRVALRDGRWVVTRSRGNGVDGETTEDDFEALRSQFDPENDSAFETHPPAVPILLVRPPRTKFARREPLAIAGAARWSGPRDADLQFHVSESRMRWRVHVTTRDDRLRTVPRGADDTAFVGADHVELWFVATEGRGAHQLGIGVRPDHSLEVRWLSPDDSTQPLPGVEGRFGQFVVEVPAWALPAAGSHGWAESLQLAVAYSDADGTVPHQDSLVGPHAYTWGRPATFEFLTHFQNAARYPAFPEFQSVP